MTEQLEELAIFFILSHDCRFGLGYSPTPADDPDVSLIGFCHGGHRTRNQPLVVQRGKNDKPEIQPHRRP